MCNHFLLVLCVGLTCLDIVTEIASFPKEDTDQRSKGLRFWSERALLKIFYKKKIKRQIQQRIFLSRYIAGEEVEMLLITVLF